MHFVTVESCIRVGDQFSMVGPIFHNVMVEIWSEGPIFSGDQNYRDITAISVVMYTVRHSFLTSFVYNREMPGNTSGEPMKETVVLENIANRPSLGYDK